MSPCSYRYGSRHRLGQPHQHLVRVQEGRRQDIGRFPTLAQYTGGNTRRRAKLHRKYYLWYTKPPGGTAAPVTFPTSPGVYSFINIINKQQYCAARVKYLRTYLNWTAICRFSARTPTFCGHTKVSTIRVIMDKLQTLLVLFFVCRAATDQPVRSTPLSLLIISFSLAQRPYTLTSGYTKSTVTIFLFVKLTRVRLR